MRRRHAARQPVVVADAVRFYNALRHGARGVKTMTNAEVARVFREVADLLEIKGEDTFRINSYRRVARTLEDLPTDVREIDQRGGLESLPGVGRSSAQKIHELLITGRLTIREQLRREVPDSLLDLLRIPGTGPKKVAVLWKERGVDSLEALKRAIDEGRLDGLRGFGGKTVEKIREGIAFLERGAGRTRLGQAWYVAQHFREAVAAMRGVRRVECAGSLRRGCETVRDLDLLCVAQQGERVIKAFTKLDGVTRVLAAGGTKGSVMVEWAPGREIQVDLRVVPAESFGAALQYFTGSKQHNVRLRERAVKRGWSLNEYALSEGKRVIASREESDIYRALDLPWIPPEMREDRGELDLRHVPEDLIDLDSIRGDLHMHTVASDGHHTIEQMAEEAKQRGYEYICIADHSQSSVVANGLDEARMRKHLAAIRVADRRVRGIRILAGVEVDIRADGSLDYSDDLLAQLDFVVASNHYHMSDDIEANTRRALTAIRNPYVNLLAHPTGRLLGRRDAMPIDMEAVIAAAAETGTALEINANFYRLDLKDQHARLAAERGAVLAINCDAHDVQDFEQMVFGVLTARRGWVRRDQVLNTWPLRRITSFVQAKRRRAARKSRK